MQLGATLPQGQTAAREHTVTTVFLFFFGFGACFGLATWSHRHLFSEGHTRRAAPGEEDGLGNRLMWVLLCSALWPLMLLTGLYSAGYRARVRARSRAR